jgi:hypothetical protein
MVKLRNQGVNAHWKVNHSGTDRQEADRQAVMGKKEVQLGTCQNLSFYFSLYFEGPPSAEDS